MSKKLKQMTNDIKNAEIQVKIARQMLIDNNFQDDDIINYNTKAFNLVKLQTKFKFQSKTQVPIQYMDELSTGGINLP